ncbi:MAG: hypothetical protein ABID40_03485 [Candidatus Bipolaricaulota bacterium]
MSAYGWGGGAVRQAAEVLGPTGIEVVGTVEVHGAPDADGRGPGRRAGGQDPRLRVGPPTTLWCLLVGAGTQRVKV